MSENTIAVLFVDDSAELTAVYQRIINVTPGLKCVGVLESATDLVEVARELSPDVIVLDLTMPGRAPLEALHELSKTGTRAKTIGFSGYDDHATIESVRAAGGWGLVSKHDEPSRLMDAIREAAKAGGDGQEADAGAGGRA